MDTRAECYTAEQLCELGKDSIPGIYETGYHLVYSSPATLAFNSPGAEGFGVKRAGLSIPDSVMLIVAPGCCGRNTSLISDMPEYHNRFFYLMMDETDLITGRHLKKIPQAVQEVCEFLRKKPSVVMICITCVDALLGTDMERVCRKAEEAAGVRVRPCYMYALTREGRKPPMVHVRQSLYSMLEERPKKASSVNFLGYFAPLEQDSELYSYLRRAGVRKIREISTCRDFDAFQEMAEANFNLVLHPEARAAAADLAEKLQIPSIELIRFYQIDRIRSQYAAFARAVGIGIDDSGEREEALGAVRKLQETCPDLALSIGECINADPFELALAMAEYGFRVKELFATVTPEAFHYLRKLAQISPDTRVYCNMDPSMLYYEEGRDEVDLTIGKDAGYYHPECPNVAWNRDIQPFGYTGVRHLFEALGEALQRKEAIG